jgi:hypothetical protein
MGISYEQIVVVPQLHKRNTALQISQERHCFETDDANDET